MRPLLRLRRRQVQNTIGMSTYHGPAGPPPEAGPSSASISATTPLDVGNSSTMSTPVSISEPPARSRHVTESMPAMMPASAAKTASNPSRIAACVLVV